MEDFIFIHFPRGVGTEYFVSGQSMGTIQSMYVVVQGVMVATNIGDFQSGVTV